MSSLDISHYHIGKQRVFFLSYKIELSTLSIVKNVGAFAKSVALKNAFNLPSCSLILVVTLMLAFQFGQAD